MMPKLLTVQFAVPDDEPAASITGMAETLQEAYDTMGIAGSFVVTDIAEYPGDPATFYDEVNNAERTNL